MIIVDVNLLIYATFNHMPEHPRVLSWIESRLNGPTRVGLPWHCLLGYLRIGTNRRAFANALTMAEAWGQIKEWLSRDNVWIPAPTERHADILGRLLAHSGLHGNLVSDAHLAALAIEHGLTLCSNDGDFARFKELKWENPLAG